MTFTERRTDERRSLKITCSVRSVREQWSCSGKIRDISERGIGLDILKVPQTDDELMVYMLDEGRKEYQRKGVVAWFNEKQSPEVGSELGLQFI